MNAQKYKISIVTPTFRRPSEALGLLENLANQKLVPDEVILVDGAPPTECATEKAIKKVIDSFPFEINYVRYGGGTALQRNRGIEEAQGSFVALIDDDVRLESDFLEKIIAEFDKDLEKKVGGIVGYRKNQYFRAADSPRWRWYRRLKLLTVFEPGKYDFNCGYPINSFMQPTFDGTRQVDFMTTACAVWRREVFASGLRFDAFFKDYGVLEDAHFSLRAAKKWTLLQSGDALCRELHAPNGRVSPRRIGYKCVVNYYFVFQDIVNPLSAGQKFRFWRYQAFEFFRIAASAVRRRNWRDIEDIVGRLEGIAAVMRGAAVNIKK